MSDAGHSGIPPARIPTYPPQTLKERALNYLPDPIQHLATLAKRHPRRLLIGLAGLPGSGKTTQANAWQQVFSQTCPDIPMQVLGMDGFHLSKAQLAAMPDPERAFARRGAPWTFDASGFVQKIQALQANTATVTWPTFEHNVGDPIADAIHVPTTCQLVLVEGLYLLYREGAWADLAGLFDEIWFLDTPLELAQERLLARHQAAWGISREQAADRIARSDGKNAALVWGLRDQADWWVAA